MTSCEILRRNHRLILNALSEAAMSEWCRAECAIVSRRQRALNRRADYMNLRLRLVNAWDKEARR